MQNNGQHIDEALLWEYLMGNLEQSENQLVEDWIAQSESNQKEFEALKKLVDTTGDKHFPTFNTEQAWENVHKVIDQNTPEKSIWQKYGSLITAAAALLVLAFLIKGINTSIETDIPVDQPIEIAEIGYTTIEAKDNQDYTLPDGSIVSMKQGALITYSENFNTKERNLRLVGDAYFDVERNENLPFVISGDEIQIEVLGTEFMVNQSGKDPEIVVTEGKVMVGSKPESSSDSLITIKDDTSAVTLIAGEKVLLKRKERKLVKEISNDPNLLAWKTKILQFNKTKMQEVIKKIEEVYEVKISLSEKNIENCSLTAKFENQSVEQIMQTLSLTFNIKIEKDGETYQLNGKGC